MGNRHLRAFALAMVALLLVVGSALAANPHRGPSLSDSSPSAAASDQDENESAEPTEAADAPETTDSGDMAPSSAKLAQIVTSLADHGITTTTDELKSLASQVGLGGAVRVLLIAHAANKTPGEILAMFKSGMGWGQIIHQLNLSMNAGIGDIMSNGHGNGHGNGNGHGQGKGHGKGGSGGGD